MYSFPFDKQVTYTDCVWWEVELWVIFPWKTFRSLRANLEFPCYSREHCLVLITGLDSICWIGGEVHREILIWQINYAILLPNLFNNFLLLPRFQSVFVWRRDIVLLNVFHYLPMACRKSQKLLCVTLKALTCLQM